MIMEFKNDWKWYIALLFFTVVSFGAYGVLIWQMLR